MPKTLTCHDALLVFKKNSFLVELREYEVELKIVPAPLPDIPGRFYVIIQDNKIVYDSAWIINLHKSKIEKGNLKKILDEIEESKDPNNDKPKMIEYSRTIREKEIKDIFV